MRHLIGHIKYLLLFIVSFITKKEPYILIICTINVQISGSITAILSLHKIHQQI